MNRKGHRGDLIIWPRVSSKPLKKKKKNPSCQERKEMLFDSIWALFLGKHVADIYRHAVESPNQGRAAQEIKRREKGRECFKYAELPATDRRPTLTAPLSLSF